MTCAQVTNVYCYNSTAKDQHLTTSCDNTGSCLNVIDSENNYFEAENGKFTIIKGHPITCTTNKQMYPKHGEQYITCT